MLLLISIGSGLSTYAFTLIETHQTDGACVRVCVYARARERPPRSATTRDTRLTSVLASRRLLSRAKGPRGTLVRRSQDNQDSCRIDARVFI